LPSVRLNGCMDHLIIIKIYECRFDSLWWKEPVGSL